MKNLNLALVNLRIGQVDFDCQVSRLVEEKKKVKNGRVTTPKFVYLIQWIKMVFIGV